MDRETAHRFNPVADVVEANLAGQISVTDLAAVAGVETSWFTRLFTRTVGCPPYQYVLNRRVLRAQSCWAHPSGLGPVGSGVERESYKTPLRMVRMMSLPDVAVRVATGGGPVSTDTLM